MLRFHSDDPGDTPFKLKRAVKDSGLTLQQICDRLEAEYGVSITTSALSHSISRGTIRLRRTLQILAVSGVTQIEIKE
jgi:peroxiredoxin